MCAPTGQVGLEASFAHELRDDVDGLPSGAHGQELDELRVVEALQGLDLLHKLVLLGVLWRTHGDNSPQPSHNSIKQLFHHPSIPLFLLRVVGAELIPAGGIYPTCLSQSEPAAAPTLLQGFDSHPPVLRAPQGLPHLSKVALAQFPQEAELLAWPLPRLHVEELPLQTEQRRRERRAAGGPTSLVRKEQRIRLDSCLQHVYFQ